MMKKVFAVAVMIFVAGMLNAQKVDSIFFHLYTDSLKKGQHNYINVDGKLSNGQWQPLTAKELQFTTTDGELAGNELIIPEDFKPKKVTIKAVLRSNPAIWKEITIWIKQLPDPPLPTEEEVMRSKKGKTRKN